MIKKLSQRWTPNRAMAVMCLAMLFTFGGNSLVYSQSTTTKPKPQKTIKKGDAKAAAGASIVVGEKFPELKLKDQDGEMFDMAAALKDGPVALVIFRSADW